MFAIFKEFIRPVNKLMLFFISKQNYHDPISSRANLITIGPVTPEITRVTTAWMRRQNQHIPPNILATTGPI